MRRADRQSLSGLAMQIDTWLTFCMIALLATLCPGPATLLVTAHSLQFGTKRALYTIAGNLSGLCIISAGAAAALRGVSLYSEAGFVLVKMAGALYLFYLGCRLWCQGVRMTSTNATHKHAAPHQLYAQGLFMSVLNPMAITFIAALSAQFIIISEPLIPQFSILTLTFTTFSLCSALFYALIARTLQCKKACFTSGKLTGRVFGSAFIGAGAFLSYSLLQT